MGHVVASHGRCKQPVASDPSDATAHDRPAVRSAARDGVRDQQRRSGGMRSRQGGVVRV